ncbi:MAG TPA: hypothetical protein VF857_10835 [Spirochaetota bacterium]
MSNADTSQQTEGVQALSGKIIISDYSPESFASKQNIVADVVLINNPREIGTAEIVVTAIHPLVLAERYKNIRITSSGTIVFSLLP